MKWTPWLCVLPLLIAGCATPSTKETTHEPRTGIATDDPESWKLIAKTLGHEGVYAREVYTITIPRDDLMVATDIGDVPTAAGLETTFYFFKCPCGRTSLTGRFVVADYEANDVIDELQTDGIIKIASMAPMLLREKPRLLVIQFQGEGNPERLAAILKGALNYTGDARFAPAKPADN